MSSHTETTLANPKFGRNYYKSVSDKSLFAKNIDEISFDSISIEKKKDIYIFQDRFDSVESKAEFLSQLSDRQLYYRENGYVIERGLIETELLDELASLRQTLKLGAHGKFPDYTPYVDYEVLKKICCSEKLHSILCELHGEHMGVRFNLSPLASTERGWHQDAYLDDEYSIPRCAAWIALDNVPMDCGPFEYVPGSHRWNTLSRSKVNSFITEELRWPKNHPGWSTISEAFVDPACIEEIKKKQGEIKPFLAKKGDVLIWHGRLLHRGAPPINKDAIRPGLITHYSSVIEITNKNPNGNFMRYGKSGGYYWLPKSKSVDFISH